MIDHRAIWNAGHDAYAMYAEFHARRHEQHARIEEVCKRHGTDTRSLYAGRHFEETVEARHELVKALRDDGYTWQSVADMVGVTAPAARHAYKSNRADARRRWVVESWEPGVPAGFVRAPMNLSAKNIQGQRFGRLEAMFYVQPLGIEKSRNAAYWACECDCGRIVAALSKQLRKGHTRSCGCLQKEVARETLRRTRNERSGASQEGTGTSRNEGTRAEAHASHG